MNFITGNKFRELADFVIDEESHSFKLIGQPKNIFLFTDWVDHFVDHTLPTIDWEFNLITHNADASAGDLRILDNPYLKKWYGMNCRLAHPKLVPIPIGIANGRWPHGDENALRNVMYSDIQRDGVCYCNFSQHTHPDRRAIHETLKKFDWITFEENNLGFEDYLKRLASFKFVISPRGNSVDCHRVWEALYVGTIPIITEDVATDNFIDNLPIDIVSDWNYLPFNKIYMIVSDKIRNLWKQPHMLDFDYWKHRILNS